jgi:hypothetical protein
MVLRLRYFGETTVAVEGLTPERACDKSFDEIRRFEFFHGNRKTPLAEMFEVRLGRGEGLLRHAA